MEDCAGLLATAQQLNIKVVGVAFHVGSGATNPQAFADAIAAARLVSHQCYHACTSMVLSSMLPCLHINGMTNAANQVSGHCHHACTLSMTRLSRHYNIDTRDPITCYFSTCPCCLLCGSLDQILVVLPVLSVQLTN